MCAFMARGVLSRAAVVCVVLRLYLSFLRIAVCAVGRDGLRPVAHRLPGLFREPVLRARMMPLRYPTDRLHSAFPGKRPRFEDLMTATREGRA